MLSFNATYSICTRFGFISNFKEVLVNDKPGYSFDIDWDPACRSYFSKRDARTIQKALKTKAAIQDETEYVETLKEKLEYGLASVSEIEKCYQPIALLN